MNKNLGRFFLILIMALVFAGKSHAWQNNFENDKLRLEVWTENSQLHSSQPLDVILKFEMKNGWHILAENPGDIGRPTVVKLDLPEGYQLKNKRWSAPKHFETDGIVQFGYDDTAYYRVSVVPIYRPERQIRIPLNVSWLSCREECIPGKFATTMDFEVTEWNVFPSNDFKKIAAEAEQSFTAETAHTNTSNSANSSLLLVLLMAFVGGIILNFMPCIFPILTLKAISLIQGRFNHREMRIDALLYMLGVVVSFLLVAGILAVLRAQGEAVGWGFQLQNPYFVVLMLLIFVVVLLLLLDLIALKNPLADKLGRLSMSDKRIGAFATGFFAVLIASPCTAPFMGIAIGYTLSQAAYVYVPVFLFLGLGYALPFTLVGFFPKVLHKILPKPGRWMEILKKIFAIPVFLTCVWLGWVLYNQLAVTQTASQSAEMWQEYDANKVKQLVANGEPILLNFTAKWCITCLANERLAFRAPEFEKLVQQKKIHLFKGDWTNENPEITKALASYGRNSIPLYVYYDGKQYHILPQLLTPSILCDHLK